MCPEHYEEEMWQIYQGQLLHLSKDDIDMSRCIDRREGEERGRERKRVGLEMKTTVPILYSFEAISGGSRRGMWCLVRRSAVPVQRIQ